jgi:hypothetical protein
MSKLSKGQQAIVDYMRSEKLDMDADTYAYLAYTRDINDLTDEELTTIPEFLLEPWLKNREEEA